MNRAACLLVALVLGATYHVAADFRRARFIPAVVNNDAPPAAAIRLPGGSGEGLPPADRVRVALVDGAGAETSAAMPAWRALCARGLDLAVDVGFPTVSLPVQVALWTGRTQQQTGIWFHSGNPLRHPLTAPAIPPQVPGAIAIAESHPYIVQSLGFADARPPLGKALPTDWAERWVAEATGAVASPSRLVLVHILRVDTAGHKFGRPSPAWTAAATSADAILAQLIAAAPDARWVVLADHDHIAGGGHGSEDVEVRVVRACLAGPGVAIGRGGPVSIVDLSRAIADSLEVRLADDAPGRPLAAALAAPVGDDDVLPRPPAGRVATALAALALGLAVSVGSGLRRGPTAARSAPGWWLLALPWWFPIALGSLVLVEGVPTLSTPFIYKPKGLDMAQAMAPGLGVLAISLASRVRAGWGRAVIAQLALPFAVAVGGLVITGAVPLVWGEAVCPIVPRWTGWLSPVLLSAAMAAAVAGLGLLANAVLPGFGPSAPEETRRNGRAAP